MATARRIGRSQSPALRTSHGHDTWMKKGAINIRINAAMTNTGWAYTGTAATVRLRQCAQTALCRYRRVPPLPPPSPQTSVRTIRPPELTPNRGHMHGGATGSIPHAEESHGATVSDRLEGWSTASKRLVWGRQGALGVKKLGSGHVGPASTISMPVQTTEQSFRTSRSRKGLMNYLTLDG